MNSFNTLIENIKNLSIEELSDSELDVLKEQIIKLLVDIQIQKDINKKSNEPHISTDDIQIQLMQKTIAFEDPSKNANIKTQNEKEEITEESIKKNKVEDYQTIIKTEISEEVMSIYTKTKNIDIAEHKLEQPENSVQDTILMENTQQKDILSNQSINKIVFTINDKFRILKKLFHNNRKEYEQFINELNSVDDYINSERIIRQYLEKNNWDDNSIEYQILIKQNKKRF